VQSKEKVMQKSGNFMVAKKIFLTKNIATKYITCVKNASIFFWEIEFILIFSHWKQ